MKKEYIVELREEEADELMDEHWVGELVRCKNCKYGDSVKNAKGETMIECALLYESWLKEPDWYCADGERKEGNK